MKKIIACIVLVVLTISSYAQLTYTVNITYGANNSVGTCDKDTVTCAIGDTIKVNSTNWVLNKTCNDNVGIVQVFWRFYGAENSTSNAPYYYYTDYTNSGPPQQVKLCNFIVTDTGMCNIEWGSNLPLNPYTNFYVKDTSRAVSTGINKLVSNNKTAIYPNPSNGSFVIETTVTTKQTINIYDVNGRMVLSQLINSKAIIDTSTLPSGVYNVSIVSDEGIVNKRIVISH